LHSRYREKKQLRETVATAELLRDGQVIVNQQLYSSPVVGIDNSRVYCQATSKHRAATKNLSIPPWRNLQRNTEVNLLVCVGNDYTVSGKGEIKAGIGWMGFLG
jgi:hypothetical protein